MESPEARRERLARFREERAPRRFSLIPDVSDRLGMSFPVRLLTVSGVAFLSGFGLGGAHGSQMAGYRYRAENAHRFPTTPTGWFLYHKTKNYHMTLGAIKTGSKMGATLGFWGGSFVLIEGAVDNFRSGTKDAFSSMIAGLAVAGAYSVKTRSDRYTAARLAKTSLKFSALFGLAQDALNLAKGNRVSYVDFIIKIFRGSAPS